ncbi:hypothetical protein, partial [Victivallis vadensis]|uniref:hypothetical protein n=1 Tax=Victivallis vadensis TaxID=172901 RepID=UPI001C9C473A
NWPVFINIILLFDSVPHKILLPEDEINPAVDRPRLLHAKKSRSGEFLRNGSFEVGLPLTRESPR